MSTLPSRIVLLVLVCTTALALVVPRGGGYALHFDKQRADIVSFRWTKRPTSELGFTTEFWFALSTPDPTYNPIIFGGSVFDTSTSPPYDNPYDLTIGFLVNSLSIWRVMENVQNILPGILNISTWYHVAYVVNFNRSSIEFYLNGELNFTFFSDTGGFTAALPEMIITFGGQSAGDPVYTQAQLYDGSVDEFRVWDGIRTPEQIAELWDKNLQDPLPSDLNLYFDFDQLGSTVVDRASGHVAKVGKLATTKNYMEFDGGRSPQAPTAPTWIVGAPVYSPLLVVVVDAGASTPFQLKFPSDVSLEVAEPPSNGTVTTPNGKPMSNLGPSSLFAFVFTPAPGQQAGTAMAKYSSMSVNVSSVNGNTSVATVVVFVWNEVFKSTPSANLTVTQNTRRTIVLGGFDCYSVSIPVQITALPKGTLFSKAGEALNETHLPWMLDDSRGEIDYLPETNVYGETLDSFSYQWMYREEALTAGTIFISIDHVNQRPESSNMTIDAGAHVELEANDPEGEAKLYFTVSELPRFGKLIDLVTSKPIPTDIELPLALYVEETVDGSSQYSDCPDSDICGQVANEEQCAAQTHCTNEDWSATQIVGKPDHFPMYGDSGKAWTSNCFGATDWLVFKIRFPMYLTHFNLYETYNPGAITSIAVAASYTKGQHDEADWHEVWSVPEPDNEAKKQATVFIPPTCPVPVLAQYIKLVFTHDPDVCNAIDAAKFWGTSGLPPGYLYGKEFKYLPDAGVFSKVADVPFDSFSFKAFDCALPSESSTVKVMNGLPEKEALGDDNNVFAVVSSDVQIYDMNGGEHGGGHAVKVPRSVINFGTVVDQVNRYLTQRGETAPFQNIITVLATMDHVLVGHSSEPGHSADGHRVLTDGGGHGYQIKFSNFPESELLRTPVNVPLSNIMYVDFGSEQGQVDVLVSVETDQIVHRVKLRLSPVCGEGFFQNDIGTPCLPCAHGGDKSRISEELAYNYALNCPGAALNVHVTIFAVAGGIGGVLLITCLVLRAFRGERNRILRRLIKTVFYETTGAFMEVADVVTDLMLTINAQSGLDLALMPYKYHFLVVAFVGIPVTVVGFITALYQVKISINELWGKHKQHVNQYDRQKAQKEHAEDLSKGKKDPAPIHEAWITDKPFEKNGKPETGGGEILPELDAIALLEENGISKADAEKAVKVDHEKREAVDVLSKLLADKGPDEVEAILKDPAQKDVLVQVFRPSLVKQLLRKTSLNTVWIADHHDVDATIHNTDQEINVVHARQMIELQFMFLSGLLEDLPVSILGFLIIIQPDVNDPLVYVALGFAVLR